MLSLDAPRVYVSPSSPFTIKPGPKFLLHCSAEGRPSPALQWYKNGQPYTTATTLSVQQIFVPRNSPSDSALYVCLAVNKIGEDIKSNNVSIDFKGDALIGLVMNKLQHKIFLYI